MKYNHIRRWRGIVSFLLICAFAHQDIIWAQDANITIPHDIATVKQIYNSQSAGAPGSQSKVVIQIQDAHSSLGAQEAISSVLDSLVKNYDLKLVAIEGSSGYIDTSVLKTFPDEKIRKNTAASLMSQGKMSAGEFYSIVTANKNIALYGIENKDLYRENREQFRRVYEARGAVSGDIDALIKELEDVRGKVYSEELKTFESHSVLKQDSKESLSERWAYISGLAKKFNIGYSGYPNLDRLSETIALEKKILFEKSNDQRDALIGALSKVASKPDLEKLIARSLSFKQGKESQAEFYLFLRSMAGDNSIDPEPYKDLIDFTEYIVLYDSIDLAGIFGEAKDLEDVIGEKLCASADQKRLREILKFARCVKDMFELKLTNSDFEYLDKSLKISGEDAISEFIRNDDNRYSLDRIFSNIPVAMDFYRTAEKRNRAILENTIKRMSEEGQTAAALITGGYHTKGISELLKAKETSYLVILPKFDASKGERPYVAILTNKRELYRGPDSPDKYSLLADDYFKGSLQLRRSVESFIKEIIVTTLKETKAGGGNVHDISERWIESYRLNYETLMARGVVNREQGSAMQGVDTETVRGTETRMGDNAIAVTVNFPQDEIITPEKFAEAVRAEERIITGPGTALQQEAPNWLTFALNDKLDPAVLPKEPFKKKYIAVPDLHGTAPSRLDAILQNRGFLGVDGKIAAKDTVLIIGGDIIDRGPYSLEMLKHVFDLQNEAPAHGCEVIILMGNHEDMLYRGMNGDDKALFGEWTFNQARHGDGDCRRWFNIWVNSDTHEALRKVREEIRAHPVWGNVYRLLDEGFRSKRFRAAYAFNGVLACHGGFKEQREPYGWSRRMIGMTMETTAEMAAMKLNGYLDEYIDSLGSDRTPDFKQSLRDVIWDRFDKDITGEGIGFLQLVFHEPSKDKNNMGGIRIGKNKNVICADIGISEAYGGESGCIVFEGDSISAVYLKRDEADRWRAVKNHLLSSFDERCEWARDMVVLKDYEEVEINISKLIGGLHNMLEGMETHKDNSVQLEDIRSLWLRIEQLNNEYTTARTVLEARPKDAEITDDIDQFGRLLDRLEHKTNTVTSAAANREGESLDRVIPTEFIIGVTSKDMGIAVKDALGSIAEIVIVQSKAELDGIISGKDVTGIFIDSGVTIEDVKGERFKQDVNGIRLAANYEIIFTMGTLDEAARDKIAEAVNAILPGIEDMSAADIFTKVQEMIGSDPDIRKRIDDVAAMVARRKSAELAPVYNGMPLVDKSAIEGKTYVMATTEKVAINDIFNADNMKRAEEMGVVNCFVYGKIFSNEDDARKFLIAGGYEGSLDKIRFINYTKEDVIGTINKIPGLTSAQNIGVRMAAGEIYLTAENGEKILEVSYARINGVDVVAAIDSYQTLLKMLTMTPQDYSRMMDSIASGKLPPGIVGYDSIRRVFMYLPKALPIDYGREIEAYRNAVKLISSAA